MRSATAARIVAGCRRRYCCDSVSGLQPTTARAVRPRSRLMPLLREGRTMANDVAPSLTASEALARLKEGNERFIAGHARFPTVQKEVLADLAKGQQPYATILG